MPLEAATMLANIIFILCVGGLFGNLFAGMLTAYNPTRWVFGGSALFNIGMLLYAFFGVQLSLNAVLGFALFYVIVYAIFFGYGRLDLWVNNIKP